MKTRQAREEKNACLRKKNGIKASKKEEECLPEKEKRNLGKDGNGNLGSRETEMSQGRQIGAKGGRDAGNGKKA